jgi:hypothetical protein
MPRNRNDKTERNGAALGFEAQMWQAADALRGSMDAAEYKHVVLGLLFLKYISDAFEEHHGRLEAERAQGADPEDPDEYRALNIFWVPPEARWSHLKAQAKQPTIGQLVDDAMAGIERDNPSLKGVLPKDYARPALDKQRLGQLIDLVSNIRVGDSESRSKDVLGRVYEYFLSQFASAEGKKGGEFYTPRCVVKLLVEMIEPYKGRVYDPCCGSSGMFVQSVEFIQAHASGNGNGGKARGDSLLNSALAVRVNIEIMRPFVRLCQMLASHADLVRKLAALEKKYDAQFKIMFDAIRELMTPVEKENRPIGFQFWKEQCEGTRSLTLCRPRVNRRRRTVRGQREAAHRAALRPDGRGSQA